MTDSMRVLLFVMVALAVLLLVVSIYLRRGARILPSRAAATGPGPSAAVDAEPEAELEVAVPVEFQLATAAGEPPVLTAVAIDPESYRRALPDSIPLNTRSGGISCLAPILRAVQLTAETTGPRPTRYLKVVLDGPLARGADGKSCHAMLLDRDGRIIDPVRLKATSPLPFSGTLLFQAVSVIVAQKHLKDLLTQLDHVRQGIDGIREFLDGERRLEVLASIEAMGQRIAEIQAGILDERGLRQLGANDQSLARIQGHLREEIQSAVAGLGEITTGFWDAARKRQEQIERSNQRLDRCLSVWLIVTETRILGWNLLVAFPGSSELKLERRRAIECEIGLLFAEEGLAAKFDQGLREQIALIQRMVRKADANRRRELLLSQQVERSRELRLQHEELTRKIAAVMAIEQTREAPWHLALKLEGDDIVEACELPLQYAAPQIAQPLAEPSESLESLTDVSDQEESAASASTEAPAEELTEAPVAADEITQDGAPQMLDSDQSRS